MKKLTKKIIIILIILITVAVVARVLVQNKDTIKKIEESQDIPTIYLTGQLPNDKEYVHGELELRYNDRKIVLYTEIRLQGNSSIEWPKKNYMIKLYKDAERTEDLNVKLKNWEPQNKFCLKSNWIDYTQSRNIVCSRLWKEIVETRKETLPIQLKDSATLGSVDGFAIKVYINEQYQGLYTWTLPKSEILFNIDEGKKEQAVVMANKNTNDEFIETAANFRKLWNGIDDDEWTVEIGEYSEELKNSINDLIKCIKDTDDETFKKEISKYLDIQSAIDYYIFQYMICGVDGLGKNLMLVTYDGKKWYVTAYDLDTTFGLHTDKITMVPADYRCPEDYDEKYSLLWSRLEKLYGHEIYNRYQELKSNVLSYDNVSKKFNEFASTISKELLIKDTTVYFIPNSHRNNIPQILKFYKARLMYVDNEMKQIGVQ